MINNILHIYYNTAADVRQCAVTGMYFIEQILHFSLVSLLIVCARLIVCVLVFVYVLGG